MATKPRNIVLAGFMGTGKTTVGQLVAAELGWPFVDADDVIVERAGMPVPEIFAQFGEPHFRQIEREVCRELAARERVVIATGGGMLVDPANRDCMMESGLVICLSAAPETLESRLAGDDNRPLLRGDWRGLLERRREAYAAIPNQIDTSERTPEQVAAEIVRLWSNESA